MFRKTLLIVLLSVTALLAREIKPQKVYKVNGNINDAIYKNEKLYVGTANGKVDILDVKTGKVQKEISLTKITDFMGDVIDSEVFSVDVSKYGILILSQDINGYSRLDVYKDGKLEHILEL